MGSVSLSKKARGLRLVIDDAVAVGELRLGPDTLARLKAEPGDLVYVADSRAWLGGLRADHFRIASSHRGAPQTVVMAQESQQRANLLLPRPVTVEKMI